MRLTLRGLRACGYVSTSPLKTLHAFPCVTLCAGAASDWWGSLVVWLYRACVYLTPLFTSWAMATSIRTASVFIRMTYIVKKKESLRKMLSFTFDLKRRGTNAMIHHRSIIFETKGVLFMVMPNPSLQCTAVKSFIYYNATFVSRYLFFFLSEQAIVKFLKGVNKTQQ